MSNALGHFSNDDMEEVARKILLEHEGGRLYYHLMILQKDFPSLISILKSVANVRKRSVWSQTRPFWNLRNPHEHSKKAFVLRPLNTRFSHIQTLPQLFMEVCVQKSRNSLEPRVKIFSFNVFQHPIVQRWDLSLTVFFHSVYEDIFANSKQDLEYESFM